jgi:predicted Zn-dependent peptidase
MKKLLYIFIFIFVAAFTSNAQLDRSQPPKPGQAPLINIGDYSKFTLPNGLKVIVVENHQVPVISWQLTLDIDPVMEGDAKGYVDLAGDLLRAGTQNRSKAQLDEEIDFIGASLSTYATGLYGSSLSKHREKLLSLMSDVLLNPTFPQEEMDKSLTQYLSALPIQESDANAMVDNLVSSVVYGSEHPYGEVVTKESLENITREHVTGYYQTYFKPNTAYLVVVGDIKVKDAKKLVKKYFGKWTKGEVPHTNYSQPTAPAANKVAFANREGAVQSVIAVSYPVDLKPGHPDAIKSSVMNGILGGGVFSGRLMQNLREDKAYTYGANSSLSSDRLVGRFTARTEVGTNVTDSALVEILHEMNRMVKEPVEQEALTLVKNYLNGSFARSLESPRTIANFALNIERYNLSKDYYATYLEKLAAVSVEDVSAMAKKYIRPENSWILVGGNKADVATRLARFSAANEVLFYDAYGRPVETTEVSVDADLTAEKVIEKYVEALGGKDKLLALKDVVMKMTTSMQGMTIEMSSTRKSPDKVLVTTSLGGNVIQKQVYDGSKGVVTAMGQTMELSGKQLEDMKAQANMTLELDYGKLGYELNLLEVENVGDKPAYKIQVTSPAGSSVTDYYDLENGLKVKSVSSQDTQMGPMTVTTIYEDYRDVEGLKFPFLIKQQAGPQNVDLKVVSLELNTGVGDEVFSTN